MIPTVPIPSLLKKPQLWRFTGFVSSVIGLICYALSSPFEHIFGEWNFLKIFLYSVGSFIMCCMVLFAKKWQLSRSLMLKAHVGFLVLMLTSVYSFFCDKGVNGKPDILGLISCTAFAMMSFSLSRQIDMGFEVDLLNFFLGCLTIQLMKINLLLALVGAVFCYILIVLRSSLDSQQHIGTSRTAAIDHVAIEIDAATRLQSVAEHDSNSGIQSQDRNDGPLSQSLRRRRAGGNTSEASARIQAAFRAQSLRRRMAVQYSNREVEARRIESEAHRILAAMKIQHAFGNYKTSKMTAAAIRIQRIFRAWKIHREFLYKHHQDTKIQESHQSLSLLTTPNSVCRIQIKGMGCTSCSSTVESALQVLQGVHKVLVALASEEAQVHYNPNVVTCQQILEATEDTGYEAALISSGEDMS